VGFIHELNRCFQTFRSGTYLQSTAFDVSPARIPRQFRPPPPPSPPPPLGNLKSVFRLPTCCLPCMFLFPSFSSLTRWEHVSDRPLTVLASRLCRRWPTTQLARNGIIGNVAHCQRHEVKLLKGSKFLHFVSLFSALYGLWKRHPPALFPPQYIE